MRKTSKCVKSLLLLTSSKKMPNKRLIVAHLNSEKCKVSSIMVKMLAKTLIVFLGKFIFSSLFQTFLKKIYFLYSAVITLAVVNAGNILVAKSDGNDFYYLLLKLKTQDKPNRTDWELPGKHVLD